MSIFIENELDRPLPEKYREYVEDIVQASIDYVSCPYECELNVFFTNSEGIRKTNYEFRQIDAPTDVLSFPLIDYDKPGDFSKLEENPIRYFNQDSGELMLGDIILNIDKVESQAKEYGHTRRRELAFLTAHSMLHLFGYDHIDDDERIVMEQMQEKILNTKGYTRDNEEE